MKIASLEEELARLKRGRKRKAVPNPNKRFMALNETLSSEEVITGTGSEKKNDFVVSYISSEESGSDSELGR
jgi:hypothetical protein